MLIVQRYFQNMHISFNMNVVVVLVKMSKEAAAFTQSFIYEIGDVDADYDEGDIGKADRPCPERETHPGLSGLERCTAPWVEM